MIQAWVWVAYLFVSLVLLVTLAVWTRRRSAVYLWLLPAWAFLVWPQVWQPGASELVPHWINMLATFWSKTEMAFAWALLPILAAVMVIGACVDLLRARRRRRLLKASA